MGILPSCPKFPSSTKNPSATKTKESFLEEDEKYWIILFMLRSHFSLP